MLALLCFQSANIVSGASVAGLGNMLIFFFHVTLRYVTFKKSWIRHCPLGKSCIRHRARYVTLRYVYKIVDSPLCTCEILDPPPCTLRYVTFTKFVTCEIQSWIRHCALVKSWIRHRARYVTLRYVYKILDPPLSLVKSWIRHCARYFTLRYVTLRLQNPGSATVTCEIQSWIRHCALVKSWIRHRARYVTLRYVYKILDPPLSLVKSWIRHCALVKSCIRHCARYFTLRYVTLRLKNPGSATVHL